MLWIVNLVILLLLILIAYQDYKYRAVSWIIFPVMTLAFIGFNLIYTDTIAILKNSLINLLFLVFTLGITTVYFSLKHRKLINISNGFIGWGDILFFVSLTVLFSPLNFLLFYVVSLLVIVVGTIISKLLFTRQSNAIPLAGLQAFILLLCFCINALYPFGRFASDEWILESLFL